MKKLCTLVLLVTPLLGMQRDPRMFIEFLLHQTATNISEPPEPSLPQRKRARSCAVKSADGLFHCQHEGCEYVTAHRDNFIRHHDVHDEAPRFKCPYPHCTFSTKHQRYLKEHAVVHTGLKAFVCDYPGCCYRGTQPGNLVRHRLTHHGIYPYQCSVCGGLFSKLYVIRNHVRHAHNSDASRSIIYDQRAPSTGYQTHGKKK